MCVVLTGCRPSGHGAAESSAVERAANPTAGDKASCAEVPDSSFRLDRAALMRTPGAARLLEKLDASPHRYFRALGRQYALRTCAAFHAVRPHLPSVAIHGDAHVEQFVVTPTTAGMEDFDQSGFGPAVIDIVRFAASLHLVCREVSWPCRADFVVDRWLDAYRESIDHPVPRQTPALVARLRASSPTEPGAWLAWADGLMTPLSAEQERSARAGWAEFEKVMLDINPARAASYYEIVRVGALQMGIGSGLETKLLFHLRGATDDPLDDAVVEARSSKPAVVPECSTQPMRVGTIWPLLFMTTLGSRMPDVFGTATLSADRTQEFWLASWVAGYRELSVGDLQSEAELVELAEDAARQLAGHFWVKFPESLRAIQRRLQLTGFDLVHDRARTLARELADETFREWQRFHDAN